MQNMRGIRARSFAAQSGFTKVPLRRSPLQSVEPSNKLRICIYSLFERGIKIPWELKSSNTGDIGVRFNKSFKKTILNSTQLQPARTSLPKEWLRSHINQSLPGRNLNRSFIEPKQLVGTSRF